MANAFYDPGEQRAAKVEELFSKIAPRYDLANDLQSFGLHRRWKRIAVKLAQPAKGQRCLDVCCGTGDLGLALARAGGEVTGLDFTEAMLEVARRNAKAVVGTLSGSLRFIHGDAMQLPFPDSSFDVVMVGYGLRNLSSWQVGLGEMVRVARPGARIVALDFGKPDNGVLRGLYFSYLRLLVPILGKMVAGNAKAYAYIIESLKHYPAQNGVAQEMQALGLAQVKIVNLLGGVMSINFGLKPGQ